MAKKVAVTKVLSCLVIFLILTSAVPFSVLASNSSDDVKGEVLEKTFTGNNSAEVIIPLFNNWTEDDNSSGDCAPMPDANMPEIYLNDTQESVASWDSGNDTGATILTQVSNDTRKNVSALSCNVYVKIDDDTCVGYDVYVDGVYKLTEGEGGTPDGCCAFYVTAGTHTIEIRKNGCPASITHDFLCGHTYRWVSMPDYWCECGDQEESKEVKFRGTVTGRSPEGLIGAIWWDVNVGEWISGSLPCSEVQVTIAMCPPFGSYDESICKGDRVEVYGKVNPWGGDEICTVGLNGASSQN